MRNAIRLTMLLLFFVQGVFLYAQQSGWQHLSTYYTDVFNQGAAGTVAFDAASARLFFTNAGKNALTILDISAPATPALFKEIDLSTYGSEGTCVAVSQGVVAVAVENAVKQNPGVVVFFDTDGNFLKSVAVGASPGMLTFTPDGSKVLTANEGEPDADYLNDPEGSVSVINVSGGVATASAKTIDFTDFNGKKAYLRNKGVRIYGPNATVAQDLEPEYITVTPDGTRAYVTLQENNALAVIDLASEKVLDILPMGYKDHRRGTPELTQYRLDTIAGWPNLGTPVYGGGQPTVKLGGFSGLYFDPTESDADNYVFYTIPDRGPVDEAVPKANVVGFGTTEGAPQDLRPFKLPGYQARIVKLRLNRGTQRVTLENQIFLRRYNAENQDTLPITGFGNIIGFDEIPVTYQDANTPYLASDWIDNVSKVVYTELPHDPFGGDMEGIVRDKDGNFWLCDEYRPALYKVNANGLVAARYVPIGSAALSDFFLPVGIAGLEILPKNYSKRRANRGFEAIAYDPEANIIYAFFQSPVENPNSAAVRDKSDVIRILGVNASNGQPVSEYVYLLERNREAGLPGDRVDKISDAVYAGNGRFLVMERDAEATATAKKYVQEITLLGATNILTLPLARKEQSTGPNDKTLEMMTADDLVAAGIKPANKTKVLNLPSLGYLPNDKPEGLTLLPGGNLAVINDNDFGLAGGGSSDETSLGIIEFGADYGFDASDRDDAIRITAQPVLGMLQPDAIASFSIADQTYLITANEGDARDYSGTPGLVEETRVSGIFLDPLQFDNADSLRENAALGRLTISNTQGDLDGDGLYDRLYAFGGRSFSILDAAGNLLHDSGDALEAITAQELPAYFNSNNDDNDSFDSRSDNKGPEPKAVTVGEFMGQRLAFIGLERIGGVMLFNIDDPRHPQFVDYISNRNFGVPAESRDAGDLGTGYIAYIRMEDSPVNLPLLVTANEVSGTVSIFSLGEATDREEIAGQASPWRLFPNPAGEQLLTNIVSDYEVYSTIGARLLRAGNTDRIDLRTLPAGAYLLRDVARNRARLFVKQ